MEQEGGTRYTERSRIEGKGRMVSASARDPVLEKGMEIFSRIKGERPSLFGRKQWTARVMEAAMRNTTMAVPKSG